MQDTKKITLPSYTLLRQNCHSSSKNHICYLTSTTQIVVIRYPFEKETNKIEIKIPLQPVRSMSIYESDGNIYLAVAMISRFLIYKNKQLHYQSAYKLQSNIVEFVGGYIKVALEMISGKPFFIFGKMDGELFIVDIMQKITIRKAPLKRPTQFYHSMEVSYPFVYLGDSLGKIECHKIIEDSEQYQAIGSYNSNSNLPIMNILKIPTLKQILCTTCTGQLIILSMDLSEFSLISIHTAAIYKLLFDQKANILYTFGEDCILNMFKMNENRQIQALKSQKYLQRFSVIFRCHENNYLGFYEENSLIKI